MRYCKKSIVIQKMYSFGKFHLFDARDFCFQSGYVIYYSKKKKLEAEKMVNRWSLSNSALVLDELFDNGVKLLDSASSESSEENEQKACNEGCDFIDSSCSNLTPESKGKQVSKVKLTQFIYS